MARVTVGNRGCIAKGDVMDIITMDRMSDLEVSVEKINSELAAIKARMERHPVDEKIIESIKSECGSMTCGGDITGNVVKEFGR
jgi:hypothetical protein